MALVKRPDVNIRDNLNKFGKTCRAEGQVTQDLESIGLGVRGDTELGLSRASFTGLSRIQYRCKLRSTTPCCPNVATRARAAVGAPSGRAGPVLIVGPFWSRC
jgi:hypothetical protein